MSPKFGNPTRMTAGQWAGKVMRFSLEVAQQPDVGRKSGDKDRRPIANVPITRVKVLEINPDGSETILPDDSIKTTDLLCQVSLTAGVSTEGPAPTVLPSSTSASNPSAQNFSSSYPSYPPPHHPHPSQQAPIPLQNPVQAASFASSFFAAEPPPPLSTQTSSSSVSTRSARSVSNKNTTSSSGGNTTSTPATSAELSGSSSTRLDPSSSSSLGPPLPKAREHIKATASGSSSSQGKSGSEETTESGSGSGSAGPVGESYTGECATVGTKKKGGKAKAKVKKEKIKPVRNVFGNLFIPATRLTDMDGSPGIWFVFQDIAIRTEGQYSLHFQVFDLESRSVESYDAAPILADCFSQPFIVFSPRYHPGVPPSTELAKHFVAQGFRLTLKKGGSNTARAAAAAAAEAKGKSARKRDDSEEGSGSASG